MDKTLNEVIIGILKSSKKPLSVRQITDIIKKNKLWFRPKDKKIPDATQVSARVNNYKKYFKRENGLVTLITNDDDSHKVLLVNITWNPFGWRNNSYINPKAGHQYAKENVAGESSNFNFNKKKVDTKNFIHGYVQWTKSPASFEIGGLIIFFTRNTDENKGQIVGVYGKSEIFREPKTYKVSFQKSKYLTNIKGEKDFSILFPIPLDASNYKEKSSDRMVGQNGFKYKDENFAEQILFDELTQLTINGTNEADFEKIESIYEYYSGKNFTKPFISVDEREQQELEKYLKKNKSKQEIIADLKNLNDDDPKQVIVNHKTYKRDNKTIAQLKILRDFKCQICGLSILKKDGTKYIEAAHIVPKFKKGRETPDNIILLCPNHHKEFDFGLLKILFHDLTNINFLLNGNNYEIDLSLE